MRALLLAFLLTGCATTANEDMRERAAQAEAATAEQRQFLIGCHDDVGMLMLEINRLHMEIEQWQRGAEEQARIIEKLRSNEDI